MKSNVNVFIAVILVAVLCGGVIWMQSADDEKLGWNIHDTYGDTPAYSGGAAYTNATFAGPANDGGVMTLSPSRAMRHGALSSSYAGAYAVSYGVTHASSPLTSSPSGAGLYTTSSKTFNSYGGGGNGGAAMGGAISNGRSNSGLSNPSLQGGAGVGSISPIAYSTARRGEMSSAAGDNPAQMLAENPAMAMTNAASVGNGFYGFGSVVDYSGAASYGEYNAMFGGNRSNVRGRQNAAGFGDSWWVWFDNWVNKYGLNYYKGTDDEAGYYFSRSSLQDVYDQFVADFWNSGMGDPPTFDDWLDWYQSAMGDPGYYDYGDRRYFWVPVGDILPLLLIALLYIVTMYLRRKSRTQVND